MRVLVVIPARYGSVRFPGKPLALVKGKPMIQCTYEQAKETGWEVVVATDDDRIVDTVKSFGGHVFMTSPNHVNGTMRVAEALVMAEKKSSKKYDIVVNVQGDEPFVQPEDIQKLVELLEKGKGDIATLCKQITKIDELNSSNTVKVVKSVDDKALYFSRAAIPFLRDISKEYWLENHTYYKHIGLYAFRRDTLTKLVLLKETTLENAENLEQLRWLESNYTIAIGETLFESIGVDTPEELERINRG